MIITKVVMYVKIMRKRSIMSGLLHSIPPFRPFEKWGIDLMGPLPMIRTRHQSYILKQTWWCLFVCGEKQSREGQGQGQGKAAKATAVGGCARCHFY